ncbi:MAG: IS630 family transposase [Gemmatimonadota bacterium]|nr:IS630 family transposase [Gemmatimonadota bacterium]MDH5294702.1 IS630 family transposase [Acidimicrobiia bacterium]
MAERVRVRRLSGEEGRKLQRLVRRGEGKGQASVVRYRRALIVLASGGGNTVPVIAQLVQTSEDRVREVIHNFNRLGMGALDPQWAGGRPRSISTDDVAFIVETAKTRPEKLGRPFTRWSIRKLVDYLADNQTRVVKIGRERLRQILEREGVTFQRTKTWKESNDPERDSKLDRIEFVLEHHPDRCFAFDEFGPLAIHPVKGCCWAPKKHPQRLRANYHKTCGVRQLHAVYSIGDDTMWGVVHARKSIANSLAAIKSARAARPDGEMIYVILDNLSAHKAKKIKAWCARNNVELCFTPTYSSWANPIECHFGPLREFVLNNSDYTSHAGLTRRVHAYLRWRNDNARAPEVLAALRKRRAEIRAEQQRRWGRPRARAS